MCKKVKKQGQVLQTYIELQDLALFIPSGYRAHFQRNTYDIPPDKERPLPGRDQITPCASIASATFTKPAMLAPST